MLYLFDKFVLLKLPSSSTLVIQRVVRRRGFRIASSYGCEVHVHLNGRFRPGASTVDE